MRTSTLFVALILSAIPVAAAAQTAPTKRPPPACGLTTLPLQKGNSWTYKAGAAQVIVNVLDVTPGKDKDGKPITNIQVEEVYGSRKIPMTWTCNDAGLTITPDAFFFAGEPAGGVGVTLSNATVTDVTVPADKLLVKDYTWVHAVKADATRAAGDASAKHAAAKLEIELHESVGDPEGFTLQIGYFNATKVSFELRGRGLVENEKAEIPVKRPGAIYYVKKLGIVKVDDAFDKTWELVATNVPMPK